MTRVSLIKSIIIICRSQHEMVDLRASFTLGCGDRAGGVLIQTEPPMGRRTGLRYAQQHAQGSRP